MKFKLTTYKTPIRKIEIIETVQGRNNIKAVIYQDDNPAFFVNCYDLETEANIEMNTLVLCQKSSIEAVVKRIAKKNNVNLSVKNAPLFTIGKSFEIVDLALPPLPLEWLN